ncbi:MAG: glutamine amidotransferase-related protein, partial [Thermacetogeniaceae bacterium]
MIKKLKGRRVEQMIAVIDYGMGNLRSVQKGLEKVGYPATIVTKPEELRDARGIILPGVGSFGDTMANLRSNGLDAAIMRSIEDGKPFLGICVGLQVLFEYGEEMGHHRGLGIF